MRRARAAVLVLSLLAAACVDPPLPAVETGPDLERRLRAFTGPDAVDCSPASAPHRSAPPAAAISEAIACGERAIDAHRSFRVIIGSASADCWSARGWVGGDDGLLHEFGYGRCYIDGRPSFEVRRCGEIAGRASATAAFTCVPPRDTALR